MVVVVVIFSIFDGESKRELVFCGAVRAYCCGGGDGGGGGDGDGDGGCWWQWCW